MAFSYKDYEESERVRDLYNQLQQTDARKPGEWSGGTYGQQMQDALSKLQNREKFKYDLNGDALYQQYKDRYVQQGKQAMQDTMGQAAALTGGYGSTYSQSAGQQQYNAYLQSLNDVVPELYQMALDRYNAEGNDLKTQYSLLADRYSQEYGEHRDKTSDWQNQRDYAANRYDAERQLDYSRYGDAKSYAYQDYRDQVSDAQWQKQYDENVRQFNQQMAMEQAQLAAQKAAASSSSRSGSSSSRRSSKSYDTHGYSSDQIKQIQMAAGLTQDGIWGAKTQAAYESGYRPISEYSIANRSGDGWIALKNAQGRTTGRYSESEVISMLQSGKVTATWDNNKKTVTFRKK